MAMSGASPSPPLLTVIAPTIDNYETIARVLQVVREQEKAGAIEVIIVAPEGVEIVLPQGAGDGYHSLRVLHAAMPTRGHAAASGVRAATANIVVMVEDHAFPQAGWAKALVAAHEGGYAAVGPVIVNGNPRSPVSWADLLTGYGKILAPQPSRQVLHLAGHNCSYKREALLQYFDADLHLLLNAEVIMHEQMTALGMRCYLAGDAAIQHFNFERLSVWLWCQMLHGRLHGSLRARNWSLIQKLKFVLLAPLSPLVRSARTLRLPAVKLVPTRHRLPLLLTLLAGNSASLVGELAGVILGPGSAGARLLPLEFHRERYFRNRSTWVHRAMEG